MLARKQKLNTQLQQLIDALLLAVALWLAYVVRLYATSWFHLENMVDRFRNYQWLFVVIMPFGPIMLDLQGFYQSPLNKSLWRSFVQIVRAMLGLVIIVSGCCLFLRLPLPARTVPLLFITIATIGLLTKEHLAALYIKRRAGHGGLREPVLLAGTPQDIAALEQSFSQEQKTLVEVVDRIDITKQPISDLVERMHRYAVSRVIFAAGHTQLNKVEEAVGACEIEGVPAWLATDFIQTAIAKPDFDAFGGRPMLVFRSTPEVSWALLVKAIIDRVCAFVLIVIFGIPMLLIALAIRLTSPGPVLFRQKRAGRFGQPFVMLKFRSMTTDAEMRKAELESFNQMSGPVFKLEHDPRVTPLGQWLRRRSLDELPQLLNVLSGDMSLVGPRPLPIYEVERFENSAQRRRLSVKPGITCLWQISGRNEVKDFRDWVRLDLDYIDRWSLGLDLKILLRTIPAVIAGSGAK